MCYLRFYITDGLTAKLIIKYQTAKYNGNKIRNYE